MTAVLDLFCGAGGAAMGYHQAGFDRIVGVDIDPQPNYPFEFIQANALELPQELMDEPWDLVHASPPCQAHSTLRHSPGAKDYPAYLVAYTRGLVKWLNHGTPGHSVIENVPGAPLVDPIRLCGSHFDLRYDGYELRRHRLFELSFPILVPPCTHQDPVLGVYGDLSKNRRPSTRGVKAGIKDAQHLMGIDWMTPREIAEAVPPAYTRYIGEAVLDLMVAA